MSIRIQVSSATVKALHNRLQQAYLKDEVRLVRRTTVLLDLLVPLVPMARLCERWGRSASCLSDWHRAVLLHGLDRVVSRHGGGRRPQVTPKQKQRVVELMEAGPLVVGLETACWTAGLLRVLLGRAFGVLAKRQYVCPLRSNVGVAVHKARVVSDPLDEATRLAWLAEQWPAMVRAAQRCHGLILCEDDASCAPWGSWSDPWARRGRQPEVPTSGKRQGDKGFGAMAYCSGPLFDQGLEGRLNAESSPGCLPMSMEHTPQHQCLIQDGAWYHPSAATQACLAAHSDRLTAPPWPSDAPDDHPMAYRWQQTTQRATPKKSGKALAARTVSVDTARASCATPPARVLGWFGCYGEDSGLPRKQAA